MRRLSEEPDLIKTEEIVYEGNVKFPFLRQEEILWNRNYVLLELVAESPRLAVPRYVEQKGVRVAE